MIVSLQWSQDFLLVIAGYFAILTIYKMYHTKHRRQIMLIKRPTLLMLGIGIVSLAIAHILENIDVLFGSIPYLHGVMYLIGYILVFLGFIYFWQKSAKLHKLPTIEPFFVFGVGCGVFIWLYYLYSFSIIPSIGVGTGFEDWISMIFPVIVSLGFLATLVIHPRKEAKVIRTPLWYISHGVFTHFLGYMMFAYSQWNLSMDILPVVYSALYLISGFYFILGFYAAERKY